MGSLLPPLLPEGFVFEPRFLDEKEQRSVLEAIGGVTFGEVRMHGVPAKRRIAEFGWSYSFDSYRIEPTTPIPQALLPLRARAGELAGVDSELLEEVLVTEYPQGAAIGWHRDAPPFGVVVGVSLLSTCTFRLRRGEGRDAERVKLELPPGSAYVLAGEARTVWQHSIPATPARRISITLRTLRRQRPRP